MSKELPFFKFYPSEWLLGKISFQPLAIQGAFIQCCCIFWQKNGEMHVEDIDFRIGEEMIERLKKLRFINVENGLISIKFLEEQLTEYETIREKKREAGATGGKASAKQKQASAKQNQADKIREDKNKKREEKKRKEFVPPTLDEVKIYFVENGYTAKAAIKAFEYYKAGNWKDKDGNQVQSWKQKMIANWFKEDSKQIAEKEEKWI